MNYIKKFESVDGYPTRGFPVEISRVYFDGVSDTVQALYINGDIHKYGDYYHDKISEWIDGFVSGLKWSGINVEYNVFKCFEAYWIYEVADMGGIPPNQIEKIKEISKITIND